MDAEFWGGKWAKNEISFHRSNPNPLLVDNVKALPLKEGSVIFVPLCGKTLDIAWLMSNGYRVAGVELVESAIEQLFSELAMVPKISIEGEIKHYSAQNIDIYVGDIFAVSRELLGPVDAIYDRAALVALPEELRRRYTAHLIDITNKSPQLLIAYHYDQNIVQGPPFSISDEEVSRHYKNTYNLTLVASTNVEGGMKGECEATENVWLLRNED
jgi:thiopurine S-methyltransferase